MRTSCCARCVRLFQSDPGDKPQSACADVSCLCHQMAALVHTLDRTNIVLERIYDVLRGRLR